MVTRIKAGIRPKSGFSNIVHLGLMVLLPALIYVLVRIDFAFLAAILVVLSKWRMFAVRPRYWPANIRANAVDIMVGLSTVVFMDATNVVAWQITWAVLYGLWLIFLKPGSNTLMVSAQASVAQLVALMALYMQVGGSAPLAALVLGSGLVCYLCARHFFSSFDEPYALLYSYTWGYFAAALAWVLGHWLLFYGVAAQPTLILLVIGYGLAALYYLDETDRLTGWVQQYFVCMMILLIAAILMFSDWGDKAI